VYLGRVWKKRNDQGHSDVTVPRWLKKNKNTTRSTGGIFVSSRVLLVLLCFGYIRYLLSLHGTVEVLHSLFTE
jgi:hypothetical protein